MSSNLSWRDALKQFNDKRVQEGGKYTIPKKGTPEYASVRELMGEKSDAVELKPNQTVTGKSRESSKSRTPKKTDSEEKIHKAVQTLVPTGDKPLWVDEPKPVEKKAKKEKPVAQKWRMLPPRPQYKRNPRTRRRTWQLKRNRPPAPSLKTLL